MVAVHLSTRVEPGKRHHPIISTYYQLTLISLIFLVLLIVLHLREHLVIGVGAK